MRGAHAWAAGGACAFCSMLWAQEWSWKRVGLEGMAVESVATPPDSADVIYASRGPLYESTPVESLGVYKSTDGGMTWRFLAESVNPRCGALTMDRRATPRSISGRTRTSTRPSYGAGEPVMPASTGSSLWGRCSTG